MQELFHAATGLPEAERRGYLERQASADPSLVTEVLALLDEDARTDSLLDRGISQVAGEMLSEASRERPREIGRYRLIEPIGEGGSGVVFVAERADLDQKVAIKILRDAWLSPARRERFANEQRTLARFNHPSIARIYDADTLPDGTPWFAMEYVVGAPIHRYCAAHDCSIPRVLELFRAVCEAVQHAHQHAVIHRDLKPSNILVTEDGQVKLLDFGIAKSLDEGGGDDATRTGLRLMTPAYAAPEQVRGGWVGLPTDIYSLGVVLYELLVGRPPFDLADRTPTEVERMVVEQVPERPSIAAHRHAQQRGEKGAPRGLSRAGWADLDVLCLTALQKDPSRRYRTVESLVRDVDHYLRGEPLEARPDTPGYRLGKFVRRHRGAVTASVATLIAVAALVVFYTVHLAAARNAALDQTRRTERIQQFMTNLFQGGDEEAGPSDTLRVVTLLDRGAREARALSYVPSVQAELFQTLGESFQRLGEFDRADTLLRAALDVRRARLGAGHADIATSLVALGLLRSDQSHVDEAEQLIGQGLDLARRLAPPNRLLVARAMAAQGQVLNAKGSYDGAIAVLTHAVRLDSIASAPPADLSATLTELANAHYYAGHYRACDSLNQRVLALDRRLHGDRHPNVASDLINLGAVQQDQGRNTEAERYYRAALEIYRGWYGESHYETAAALTMVARTLIPQGRTREATELLDRSLAIRERVYGPNHPSVASTLNELGLIAQKEGRLDEAERAFRRMTAIYRDVYHGRHHLIGISLANLGGVYVERKQYREAERLFREALQEYAGSLPADHVFVGIARIKLGRALLRQSRWDAAARESLTGYTIVSKQAEPSVSWLENARRDLVEEYAALGKSDRAATYRAELERGAADSASGR